MPSVGVPAAGSVGNPSGRTRTRTGPLHRHEERHPLSRPTLNPATSKERQRDHLRRRIHPHRHTTDPPVQRAPGPVTPTPAAAATTDGAEVGSNSDIGTDTVTSGMRIAAAWSWRFLVVVAALAPRSEVNQGCNRVAL
jgi:hypothetical protein